MPEGDQQRATGRLHSVEVQGENSLSEDPQGIPRELGPKGRTCVAAGSTMYHPREAASGEPEKREKTRERGYDIPVDPETGKDRKGPERKPRCRVLREAALARARRGRRRPRNGDDEQGMAGGQRPRSAVAPQPSIRDHHSRFREKLTAWNCVEVVVGSKLVYYNEIIIPYYPL